MLTRATTYESRDAWLAARKVGSSDVAPILGLSPYRTAWDVYARLVEGDRGPDAGPAAARGTLLEPVVLRRYSEATGIRLTRPPPHTLYTRDEWATASPDALADGLVVEAKTDRDRSRWGEPTTIERWTDEAASIVRPDYYLQTAHQMYVLDLPAADLAVLVPGDDPFLPELRIYRLVRDLDVEQRLVATLRAWWERHVVARVPPPLDGSDAASRHLATQHREGTRAATPAEAQLVIQYELARRVEAQAEDTRRRVGQALVAAAGPCSRLDLPGGGRVAIVTSSGRSVLDERRLLEERPDLAPVLDQYRRHTAPTSYPRVSGIGDRR